jgi:thiamine-phosphate pyrophosphorylase
VAAVPFQLCLISDGAGDGGRLLLALTAALPAAPAGAVAVQLREPTLGGAALFALAQKVRALTAAHGAALLINDRVDVALAVGADGVHLPGHGLPLAAARRLGGRAGVPLLLSAACHDPAEARAAAEAGADLITLGPVWETPSKPAGPLRPGQARVQPIGLAGLAAITATLPLPVFALGGIDDAARAAACRAAGARVACLRAVLGAADPAAAVRALLG